MSDSEDQLVFKKKKGTKASVRSIQNETLKADSEDTLVSLLGEKKVAVETVGTASIRHTIKSDQQVDEVNNTSTSGDLDLGDENVVREHEKNMPTWMRLGPLNKNKYIKSQVTMDYAADICKDYKETGRCVWGNECKFIHDRSERKTSTQLDAIWSKQQEKQTETKPIGTETAVSKECSICNQVYVRPVVTKCGHFFCEACALSHHKTNTKCHSCGKPTDGAFQPGQKKLDLLQATKEEAIQLKSSTSTLEYTGVGGWGYTKK